MATTNYLSRVVVICLALMTSTAAQHGKTSHQPKGITRKTDGSAELRKINRQDAIETLRLLASNLKNEEDRPAAAILQARAADVLWQFDQPAARAFFRQAFDAVSQPVNGALSDSKLERAVVAKRQAVALNEILRRLGNHDRKSAETLLDQIQKDQESKQQPAQPTSPGRAEMLAQIALEMAATDPKRSLELGLLALSGKEVPSVVGYLLFALSKSKDRSLSDELFRAIIATLRRDNYTYNPVIGTLSNYLFNSHGKLFSITDAANAKLFIAYLLDATQHQVEILRESRLAGEMSSERSNAGFFTFLSARALPIVQLNAPDSFPWMQVSLSELASGLSQQQLKDAATVATSMQQSDTSAGADQSDTEGRIRQAENERDSAVRDDLWRLIAIDLIDGDPEKALSISTKISDERVRKLTEDDIHLAQVANKLKANSYEDARTAASNFNDVTLKANALAQLADRALTTSKDVARASELLSEAQLITLKGDDTPDKVQVLLTLAGMFAKFDTVRGFEVLASAIKVVNHLPPSPLNDISPTFSSRKTTGLLVMRYTMVGGKEFTTGERATIDSIEFNEASVFAKLDYTQARQLGESIQNKLLRTKFFIAVTRGLLLPAPIRDTASRLR